MKQISGGEVIARMLQMEGVEKVFGIIDGTYFGFYRALHELGIEIVSPRHESSAAHMAGAYARLTGRLGVCMASNGPGVANILPGLVVEQAEGNRVLVITSARRASLMYPSHEGAYQCFDQTGVIGAFARFSATAATIERVPELMRNALRKSWQGRPGVVHLDVPENVINGKVKTPPVYWRPHQYRNPEPVRPDDAAIIRAAELLAGARAPLIHAGSGVLHAQAFAALQQVAELLHAPVTTSWAARGVLTETSPLAIPMPHVKLNHQVRCEADVVLIVGSRVGETDWWGRPPYWRDPAEQTTIQVDIDPDMIGLNKPVDLAIQADARCTLERLAEVLAERGVGNLEPRRERVAGYQRTMAAERADWDKALLDKRAPLHPAQVGAACGEVFPEDSVLVVDGGNTTIWAMFYHQARVPNRILSTFKFGMLGAGMGQAIGAALALPGKPVCCIIGDGAFGFHPQEVETARQIADQLGVEQVRILLNELESDELHSNPSTRCYICKTIRMKKISEQAERLGITLLVDGSNADDLDDYRPGGQALQELGVLSPLAETGITKAQVRQLAKWQHLPAWDKPSTPCLASRFPYGVEISHQRIGQVACAEEILKSMGFRELRVRYHETVARLEVPVENFEAVLGAREEIVRAIKNCGFLYVSLDLQGFRSGSMNEGLQQ